MGNDINTRSIDFRNLRHVINSAIDDELTTSYPFRKFKITSDTNSKTIPLSIKQLKLIKDYKTEKQHLQIARDTFLASFYLIGINISDLYELKEISNDGRIYYNRNKTHKSYSILAQRELIKLVQKYQNSERLFNFYERYSNRNTFKGQIQKYLK